MRMLVREVLGGEVRRRRRVVREGRMRRERGVEEGRKVVKREGSRWRGVEELMVLGRQRFEPAAREVIWVGLDVPAALPRQPWVMLLLLRVQGSAHRQLLG